MVQQQFNNNNEHQQMHVIIFDFSVLVIFQDFKLFHFVEIFAFLLPKETHK